jgi:hypothetical protein
MPNVPRGGRSERSFVGFWAAVYVRPESSRTNWLEMCILGKIVAEKGSQCKLYIERLLGGCILFNI